MLYDEIKGMLCLQSFSLFLFYSINVREYRRGHQKWTIQRNWKHRAHKIKKNKTETQHNMRWTPQYVNKHKQTTLIRHEPSYKHLEVKKNRTSFLCGNRNGTQNAKTHNSITQKTKKMSKMRCDI